jgi:hypothetical protein
MRAIRGAVEIQREPGCQNLQPGERRQ